MPEPPKSTSQMVADMLGIGPLMGAMGSPDFQAQLKNFMLMAAETCERTRRIEARLEAAGYKIPPDYKTDMPQLYVGNGATEPKP